MKPSQNKTTTQPLMQMIDESIIKHINSGNYHISLLHLEQILHENGFLNHNYQIRHVQCLYYVKRYTEAIEYAQKYISEGNPSKDLTFLIGLSLYEIGQYYEAANIFRFNPRWELWYRKAYIMQAYPRNIINKKKIEFPVKSEPTWTQTDDSVTVVFPYPGLLKSEVTVDFYPESVDILIYRNEKQSFSHNIELNGAILTYTCSYSVNHDNLTLELVKVVKSKWPSLYYTDDIREKDYTIQAELQKINPVTTNLLEESEADAILACQKAQEQMFGPPEKRIQRYLKDKD
ncbi:CS domain containing protein [Tritrichomonas foetus]|uniref:CS domain containing protein n=1 Tax=Tritrichomonas foetus TaxID=1144522 RepID=A0A1J4JW14_9EUKA|nr:CS domain containing protein [Tritrichomonas foetus]|eukprot:OHT03329.1 CS domain containing protein [Tritrichomonas foetus]